MDKKEKKIKEIEDFLNKNKISAMVYIPKAGVFNHFNSHNDKLRLLDHAATEILFEEKKREKNAQSWIDSELKEYSKDNKKVSYID